MRGQGLQRRAGTVRAGRTRAGALAASIVVYVKVDRINRSPGRFLVFFVNLDDSVLALVLLHLVDIVLQDRILQEVLGHLLVRPVHLDHFALTLVFLHQVGFAQVVNFLSEVPPLAICVIRDHTRMLQGNRHAKNVMLESTVLDMD